MQFVQDHLEDDPALLLLKYTGKTDFDLKWAVQQIGARQKAKRKLPTWTSHPDLQFPVGLSLEQASSEETAFYKSKLSTGNHFLDLTGGLGIDTYFLSKPFKQATYVEKNRELCDIARHNFEILVPEKVQVIHWDALEFLKENKTRYDLIYLDPARRGEQNQKLYKLDDLEPNVLEMWPSLKQISNKTMVKTSPLTDIKGAIHVLPDLNEVRVIAVQNEVKEVLLIWNREKSNDLARITCAHIQNGKTEEFLFDYAEEENSVVPIGPASVFLIEPNAAILKAGGFKSFAKQYGLTKLNPNTHLYTSSTLPEKIAGRIFKIKKEVKPSPKELKLLFPKGLVNIISRNHPLDPNAFKKKYRLKDGGKEFLIACKGPKTNHVFLCEKVQKQTPSVSLRGIKE